MKNNIPQTKRAFVALAFTMLFCFLSQAQPLMWAEKFGGFGNDSGASIARDLSGNVYITGQFEGVVDFDPEPGIVTLEAYVPFNMDPPNIATYVAKYDPDGNLIWAKQLGGFSGAVVAKGIAVHPTEETVFITGDFSGNVDFDPGFDEYYLASATAFQEIFICKLDSSGDLVFAKQLSLVNHISGLNFALNIRVDAFENVYAQGWFHGGIDADPGPGSFVLTSFGTLGQPFNVKLDALGNFAWAHTRPYSSGMTVDGFGNMYNVGYFSGTYDFDPGPGVTNVTANNACIFVQKIDVNGNLIWVKMLNNSNSFVLETSSVEVDASGFVYFTGRFNNTLDFDPGPNDYYLTASGAYDVFVCKLSPSGDFVWAKQFGGVLGVINSTDITVDSYANTYFRGRFDGVVDFDPGPAEFNLTSNSEEEFICMLDAQGDFVWANSLGVSSGYEFQFTDKMVVNDFGNLYVTGTFEGTKDFDFGPNNYELTAAGGSDAFLFKLGKCVNNLPVQDIVSCGPYPGPTETWYTSGIYYDTIFALPCDIVYTYNVTINYPSYGTDVIGSCGAPITWIDGNTYTQNNNTATWTLIGGDQNGCDSIVTLNFTIWPCTQLNDVSCDAVNVTMDGTTLRAINVNMPAYRFRIVGANNGGPGWVNNTYILDRPNRTMKFSQVPGSLWGQTYTIDVAVGDGNGNFGPFGSPCNVTTSAIPTSQLEAANCNSLNVDPAVNLLAVNVVGATGYRFRVNGAGVAPNTVISKTMGGGAMRKLKMNEVAGIISGETYTVEVAIRDALGNWGAYGISCTVTLIGLQNVIVSEEIELIQTRKMNEGLFEVNASPNPYTDDFSLYIKYANKIEMINLSVYDMSGRLMEQIVINPEDIETTNQLVPRFGKNFSAGIYLIEVRQGSNQTVIRQVKN